MALSVDERKAVEKRIASAVIRSGLDAGFAITVNDGEGFPVERSTDHDEILAAMFSVDEEHLEFFKDGQRVGWVFFVYGNDGWDVICDHTLNLSDILEEANRIADEVADAT